MEQLWSFVLLVMEQRWIRMDRSVFMSCNSLNRYYLTSWNNFELFILYVMEHQWIVHTLCQKKSWRNLQDFFLWRFFFMQNQKNEDVTSFDRSSTSSKVNRSFAKASFDRVRLVSFASIATHGRTWKTNSVIDVFASWILRFFKFLQVKDNDSSR